MQRRKVVRAIATAEMRQNLELGADKGTRRLYPGLENVRRQIADVSGSQHGWFSVLRTRRHY